MTRCLAASTYDAAMDAIREVCRRSYEGELSMPSAFEAIHDLSNIWEPEILSARLEEMRE